MISIHNYKQRARNNSGTGALTDLSGARNRQARLNHQAGQQGSQRRHMAAAPEAAAGGGGGLVPDDDSSDDGGAGSSHRMLMRQGFDYAWLRSSLPCLRSRSQGLHHQGRPTTAPPLLSPAGAPLAGAITAAAALGEPEGFDFWVDEILWTQGKVAVELMEEVLEAIGGRRVGGPAKLPKALRGGGERQSAPSAAPSSAADSARGAADVAAALVLRLGLGGGRGGTASGSGGGVSEEAATAQAGGVREDDAQLGYRHVPEWQFLWTKSIYGIKAARTMRPGQVGPPAARPPPSGARCRPRHRRALQRCPGGIFPHGDSASSGQQS
jgi:hypothetical protein